MNIFFLDACPNTAATYYNNRHCVKMILEITQIICTTFNLQGIPTPYKTTHQNHPSTKWARESAANFRWLLEHLEALHEEYTLRYRKTHKCFGLLFFIKSKTPLLKFPKEGLQPFAVAIKKDAVCRTIPGFNDLDPISQYRLYYQYDKAHIAQWKTQVPAWY